MPRTEIYICDVCGQDLPLNKPCIVGMEVIAPKSYYYSSMYDSNKMDRYICTDCVPPRRYKERVTARDITRESFRRTLLNYLR